VLIINQNQDSQEELTALVIALTGLSVRVLMSASGGDPAQAVRVIEQWMSRAARHVPEPAP
jgi:hypothetical protein